MKKRKRLTHQELLDKVTEVLSNISDKDLLKELMETEQELLNKKNKPIKQNDTKRYNSFYQSLENSGLSKKFIKKFKEDLFERQISKLLFVLRINAKLSEKQMAKKLGWTLKKVRQIESSCDYDINFMDLIDYLAALDIPLVNYERNKWHKCKGNDNCFIKLHISNRKKETRNGK